MILHAAEENLDSAYALDFIRWSISDVRQAVTLPFKAKGDLIYLVGETHELGASAYYRWLVKRKVRPKIRWSGSAGTGRAGACALPHHEPATAQGFAVGNLTEQRRVGAGISLGNYGQRAWRSDRSIRREFGRNSRALLESNSRFVISVKPETRLL